MTMSSKIKQLLSFKSSGFRFSYWRWSCWSSFTFKLSFM